jgi:hypothetical protein
MNHQMHRKFAEAQPPCMSHDAAQNAGHAVCAVAYIIMLLQ